MNDRSGLSGRQRAALIVGAIAVLVVAYVLIQGGSDDDKDSAATPAAQSTQSTQSAPSTISTPSTSTEEAPAEPAVPTVRVVDAKPQGGVKKLDFDKGDQIRFKVVSDTADEIHVHGYDLMKDVEKGGSVTFNFKATIEGRFEVELENAGTQIANLEVTP